MGIVEKSDKALSVDEIFHALNLEDAEDLKKLMQTLNKMEDNLQIYRTKKDNYMPFTNSHLKIGDVNFLSIDAKPKVEGIEVETTGNLDLENGSIIKIKVIYDENTYNIYKINIIKDIVEEDDNQTSKLIIIIVIVSIIIAIIVLLIIQLKNKKNGNNKKNSKNNKKEMPKEIKVEDKQEVVKKQNLISLADDEEIEDII